MLLGMTNSPHRDPERLRFRLRASDRDRELVAELLRTEHVAGRLDDDELDQRLGRCLAASTYSELEAITADLPEDQQAGWPPPGQRSRHPEPQSRRATMGGVQIRHGLQRLAGLLAILVLAVWALTSSGSGFWPAWVWFGLAIPFVFDAAFRWACGVRAGRCAKGSSCGPSAPSSKRCSS